VIFIKDIIGDGEPSEVWAVITAWSLWAGSISSVITSYYFSRIALRTAIDQTDNDDYSDVVGGYASYVTNCLNAVSGLLFVVGVIFFIIFASSNIGDKEMNDKKNSGYTDKKGYTPPPPSKKPPPLTEGVVPPPPKPKTNPKS